MLLLSPCPLLIEAISESLVFSSEHMAHQLFLHYCLSAHLFCPFLCQNVQLLIASLLQFFFFLFVGLRLGINIPWRKRCDGWWVEFVVVFISQ